MAKNDNLDFSSMFASAQTAKPQSKPVKTLKEEPEVKLTVSEEDKKQNEKPKEIAAKKKNDNKNGVKTTQRGGKTITSLSITTSVLEDYSDIMKIKKKSVSNAIEELMLIEIKKNAELLAVVKSLRENN